MFSRKSKAAVAQREAARGSEAMSDFAEKAVVVAGQAAEKAAQAAHQARRAATPVARKTALCAAETLTLTAEKLAEAAEKLATSEAGMLARERMADTAEAVAVSVRPKRKKHRVRKVLILGAVVGGVIGLVKSPLPGKLADKIFGAPPEDDDFDAITLPADDAEALEPSTATSSTPAAKGTSRKSADGDSGSHSDA